MQTVTVARKFETSPTCLRKVIRDVEPFMLAAGFDHVSVDGTRIVVANRVGIMEIELTLRIVDDADAALVYEQVDGMFESMRTRYVVTEAGTGSEATAVTEFALDIDVIGEFLDATVIRRQRRRELDAQFDYLEEEVTPVPAGTYSGA